MIVNLEQDGWQVIYHRAHALLAAQLAGQWRRKDAPPRLYETVAAISHHDDLEREWEGNELTRAGTPLDFTLEQGTSVEQLSEQIESSRYRGRWVTLMTSMHISRLTEPSRGTSKELDKFLDEQLELQQQYQKELEIPKEDVDAAYAFMQWCDRLSLILCQQELPADERALEISKGLDGKRYDVLQYNNELVTVQPWCFEDDRFTVNVEASLLNQVKFEDNDELIDALKQAPRILLEWTFVKDNNSTMKEDPLS